MLGGYIRMMSRNAGLRVMLVLTGTMALRQDDCYPYQTAKQDNGCPVCGHVQYLDRHAIGCASHHRFVNEFRLERDGDQIYFTYACCSARDEQTFSDQYTSWNDAPSINAPAGTDMGVTYLDRHRMDCGEKGLAFFQLEAQGGQDATQIRYHYKCGSRTLGACRVVTNPWSDAGADGQDIYLDRQYVTCGPDSYLAALHLETQAGHQMRYVYTCCKDPPGTDWPTFDTQAALASSRWGTYLTSLYGELPSANSYTFCTYSKLPASYHVPLQAII